MKNRNAIFLSLIIVVGSLVGCATVNTAKEAKGEGVKKSYEATYSEVWAALPEVIEAAGGKIKETNKTEGYILASFGISAWSWGEKVAVFCIKKSDTLTEVEVVNKRAYALNVTAREWGPKIFKALDVKLGNK